MNKKYLKIILGVFCVLVIVISWRLGLFEFIQQVELMTRWIEGFGILGPIIFIGVYTLATILFVPGLPLTLLAGVIFGPVYGFVWVSIGSTLGATLSFLIGRYIGRDFVVSRFDKSDMLKRLDQGVKEQGWKMVAITRLIPLFPFNAQNYIYGLTDIPLGIYTMVSWIAMMPATIAYTLLAGAIIGGDGQVGKTLVYIGVGIGVILLLSMFKNIFYKQKGSKV